MVMATSNKTDLLKLKAAAMAKKSKRPLEEDMDVELKAVLEKLNSDDDEVWFKGIVVLEEAARSSGEGTKILVDYFESSPDCTEILSSLQGETLRDNGKTRAVLQLLQTFMENRETEQLRSHVQRLATRLVRKLSKILASGLSLSNPRLSATVLTFISKITEVGVIQARDCWKRFSPHLNTISKLLDPHRIPYLFLLNNWDTRDGGRWVTETQKFAEAAHLRLAKTVIRRYKVHTNASAAGVVVTQYERNRKNADAIADFYNLAAEVATALMEGARA